MTPEEAAALRKPFPESAIGYLPKGGVMLAYVGHAAASDRLLQVDPEWSWEPFSLDDHGLPALDSEGNLWIRLTVCGVTRPGVGDGKNQKERIGDAIRNAAMRFGVALDLWAKEDLQAQNGNGPAATPEPSEAAPLSPSAEGPGTRGAASDQYEGPTVADLSTKTAEQQKPTTRQLKNLNRLVGTLREGGFVTTENIWVAISNSRGVEVADLIDQFENAYTPDGILHFSPLRDALTRGEASNLIDRLTRLEAHVGVSA